MTYAELLAEEMREWHDPSAQCDPHDPEIRAAVWPWTARFDDEQEQER